MDSGQRAPVRLGSVRTEPSSELIPAEGRLHQSPLRRQAPIGFMRHPGEEDTIKI